jgi:hypothetical protein
MTAVLVMMTMLVMLSMIGMLRNAWAALRGDAVDAVGASIEQRCA